MSCYFPQQCFSSSKFIYAKVSEQVKRNEYDHEICYAQIKGAKMNKKKPNEICRQLLVSIGAHNLMRRLLMC